MFEKYISNMEKARKSSPPALGHSVLSGLWGSLIAPGAPSEPQIRLYSLH